jgi:hypothetical protein
MTWLTAMEYLCHKWTRICSTCRKHFWSFPHVWLIPWIVSIWTWGELGCCVRVSIACSTIANRRVNILTIQGISQTWGKDQKCLRQVEQIRVHLWHRYSIAVNQVMASTVLSLILQIEIDLLHTLTCTSILTEWLQRTKLYDKSHYYNLVDRYEISISQMTMDLLHFTWMFSFLYHCQNCYRTWLYIWISRKLSDKKRELLTLCEHPV